MSGIDHFWFMKINLVYISHESRNVSEGSTLYQQFVQKLFTSNSSRCQYFLSYTEEKTHSTKK